jgi:hypothetical protein
VVTRRSIDLQPGASVDEHEQRLLREARLLASL